jgi:hypothetical protein
MTHNFGCFHRFNAQLNTKPGKRQAAVRVFPPCSPWTSGGNRTNWHGFTFNRGGSPGLFAGGVVFQVLLTLLIFSIFLFSL